MRHVRNGVVWSEVLADEGPKQGWGDCLLSRAAYIVEYRWRAEKIDEFYLKIQPLTFNGKYGEKTTIRSEMLLFIYTVVSAFEAMCFNLGIDNSDADHSKCSHGSHLAHALQVPHPWPKVMEIEASSWKNAPEFIDKPSSFSAD